MKLFFDSLQIPPQLLWQIITRTFNNVVKLTSSNTGVKTSILSGCVPELHNHHSERLEEHELKGRIACNLTCFGIVAVRKDVRVEIPIFGDLLHIVTNTCNDYAIKLFHLTTVL